MKYEIDPLKGAGPFQFGMSKGEVRSAAGNRFTSFKRTPLALHACDHFADLGVFANYTADGRLEAVEFASPASPILKGQALIATPLVAVKSFLQKLDPQVEVDLDSLVSRQLGISIYCPVAKDVEQAGCESVLVFAKGYYD